MTKQRIARVLTALALGAASFHMFGTGTAHAAALTDVSWSTSKAHPGDTAVRYSWSFTTATTGTVASVTMTVPSGTAGATLTVVDNYGVSAGTAALSGTTVTYTVTTPASIAAGTPILITVDGFTNTSTAGAYTSTVTTRDGVPATIDTASSNTVTFDSNTTALTVVIARTLAFTNDTDSILFLMDPTLAALADRSHNATDLTVATNAANGYTLSANATDLTGSTETIARITAGTGTGVASGSFTTNTWGFSIAAPTNGGTGTISRSGQLASNEFVGHTSTNQAVVVNNGPTNGDAVAITTRAKIDYLQPAVTYTSTITYTAAPSY